MYLCKYVYNIQDDKRMEKLKKRLEDLDLINNNIKLLNEMLSHYKEDSAEHERTIIEVSKIVKLICD